MPPEKSLVPHAHRTFVCWNSRQQVGLPTRFSPHRDRIITCLGSKVQGAVWIDSADELSRNPYCHLKCLRVSRLIHHCSPNHFPVGIENARNTSSPQIFGANHGL